MPGKLQSSAQQRPWVWIQRLWESPLQGAAGTRAGEDVIRGAVVQMDNITDSWQKEDWEGQSASARHRNLTGML